MVPLQHYRCIYSPVYFLADDDGKIQNTAKSDSYGDMLVGVFRNPRLGNGIVKIELFNIPHLSCPAPRPTVQWIFKDSLSGNSGND